MSKTESINLQDFPALNMPTRLLLGPGPSTIHPRVLKAMATPLVGHLDPTFVELMDRIQKLLRYVFQTNNRLTIPVSGTGSAAMEATVANMVEPGDNVLVCEAGYFGLRLANMAERYGGNVKTIHRPWGEVFTPSDVKHALKDFPAKVVGIVQAETSTGALQPIDEIAKIVHDQGGIIIVDAVTSLGGIPVRVDEADIDLCYSCSQKCLGSPPGLGPLTVGPRGEEILNNRKTTVPNWYLDLTLVNKYWGSERTYHHTAPISANYALYESLCLIAEEGLENAWQRHKDNAELLWEGLNDIGLECLVPEGYRINSLTTIKVPEGVNEALIRAQLLKEYNIEISGGFGELKGKIWRVGLMGYSSRKENVLLLLAALKELLKK